MLANTLRQEVIKIPSRSGPPFRCVAVLVSFYYLHCQVDRYIHQVKCRRGLFSLPRKYCWHSRLYLYAFPRTLRIANSVLNSKVSPEVQEAKKTKFDSHCATRCNLRSKTSTYRPVQRLLHHNPQ